MARLSSETQTRGEALGRWGRGITVLRKDPPVSFGLPYCSCCKWSLEEAVGGGQECTANYRALRVLSSLDLFLRLAFATSGPHALCGSVSELLGCPQRGSPLLLLWTQKGRALVDLAEKSVWVVRRGKIQRGAASTLLGPASQAVSALQRSPGHFAGLVTVEAPARQAPLCLETHPLPHCI